MNFPDFQNRDPASPEKLCAALLRLHGSRVSVPSSLDETVLRAAREHLARVSTERQGTLARASKWFAELREGLLDYFAVRRRAAWAGMAALALGVGLLVWMDGHRLPTARSADLNGDGMVDMLDAFALARELQQGPVNQSQLDLNGDGVVDERDVRALAARAVRLEQGGRS
jgi:hypothetical protein